MAFEYSCFISYAHGQRELMRSFVQQLTETFESELEAYFREEKVYVDFQRLEPGYRYNTALARSLCRSVVMVLIYTPVYERSNYCMAEYTAMRQLEENRLAGMPEEQSDRGLVIPVLLRGRPSNLPESIRDHVHYADFSRFSTADRRLMRNRAYADRIKSAASYIYELHQDLCAAGVGAEDCGGFQLPGDDTVESWGSPGGTPPSAFPGRG